MARNPKRKTESDDRDTNGIIFVGGMEHASEQDRDGEPLEVRRFRKPSPFKGKGMRLGADDFNKKEKDRRELKDNTHPIFEYLKNLVIDGQDVLYGKEVDYSGEEEFIACMKVMAANARGIPSYDDSLAEELGKFLKAHFDRAREENPPFIPERKYVPRQDEIISFLREVWSEWLVAGHLTMPILKDADYRAYQALHNWTRKNDLPDDIRVKSASDVTDEFLSRDYYRRDEVYRAASAMGRRGLKNQ